MNTTEAKDAPPARHRTYTLQDLVELYTLNGHTTAEQLVVDLLGFIGAREDWTQSHTIAQMLVRAAGPGGGVVLSTGAWRQAWRDTCERCEGKGCASCEPTYTDEMNEEEKDDT
jgi:hypothetical protein